MEDKAPIIGVAIIIVVAGLFGPHFAGSWGGLMEREGGYVNDPTDRGGETNLGVTERTARSHGYTGEMIDLPDSTAARIAYEGYWSTMRLDDIAPVYYVVADRLHDMAYHMGPRAAGRMLQDCLNILNLYGRRYPDVAVDGVVGKQTLAAFNGYASHRGEAGEAVLETCLKVKTGAYYVAVVKNNDGYEKYAYGWLRRLGD